MEETKQFEPSEDLVVLTGFFATQTPGEFIAWGAIEKETGVAMTASGRDMARRAVERAGHPAPDPVPGEGIRLVSGDTALRSTSRRARKASKAAMRAARQAMKCLSNYADTMSPAAANSLRHQQAAYAGIGLVASQTAKEADRLQEETQAKEAVHEATVDNVRAAQMAAVTQAKNSRRKRGGDKQVPATA